MGAVRLGGYVWIKVNMQPVTLLWIHLFFLLQRVARKILVPDQELNPHPLQWKLDVLTTLLPGKSQSFKSFNQTVFLFDFAF